MFRSRGTAARSFRAGFAASWPVPSWLWSLSTVSDVLSAHLRTWRETFRRYT